MKIYNTLNRKKEKFVPLNEGRVSMYSCGPTVYNYFHVGNARPFIIFDTLRRYLEYRGFEVNFVQNFTDIDDKMINKARDESTTVTELGERFIEEYYRDADGLNIKRATVHPKATQNIDAIIALISTLEKKGFAYNVDGDVYFSTKKFREYGKLSHQPLDELEPGSRIDVSESKADPMDFALWKKQKEGEPAWESPWGMGRPGWHIECSAMANKYLGATIDIHSGGQDLIFPHHENEIAQSEAANNQPFARFWMHNGYVNIDNRKMSKSANNFFTVRDIAQEVGYETVRFFMLSAHYRSPINFSRELLLQAGSGLNRIKTCIENLTFFMDNSEPRSMTADEQAELDRLMSYKAMFNDAMDDDLNTADALSAIFELVRDSNSLITAQSKSSKEFISGVLALINELCDVLGIIKHEKEEILDSDIENLIRERNAARAQKDFKRADEIRDGLKSRGIILEDTPKGVKWKRVQQS